MNKKSNSKSERKQEYCYWHCCEKPIIGTGIRDGSMVFCGQECRDNYYLEWGAYYEAGQTY
jgi:hypothetical protein